MAHFFCSSHDEWIEGPCGGCYSEMEMARMPLSPPSQIPAMWEESWVDARLYCKDCGEEMGLTRPSEGRNPWHAVGRQSQCNACYLNGIAPPVPTGPTGPLSPPTPTRRGVPGAIGPRGHRGDSAGETARHYQFSPEDIKLIEECPWIAEEMYYAIDEYERYLHDGA